MAKAKQVKPQGCWRYCGHGTRISGVPARDLTPSESAIFGDVIRQVTASGDVLYVWDTGEPEEPAAVVATTPAPIYVTTATGPAVGPAEFKDEAPVDEPAPVEAPVSEDGADV